MIEHAYTVDLGKLGTVIGYWDSALGCFETDWISKPRTVRVAQHQPKSTTLEKRP